MIVFEQPQPLDTEIAAQYGARMAGHGGGGGGGGGGGSSAQESADSDQRVRMQEAQGNENRNQDWSNTIEHSRYGAEQGERNRQVELVKSREAHAAESSQIDQRAQAQMSLQSAELTNTENMRLQRMKQAVGSVQSDHNLDEQERMDLTTQLQTGIHPLEARLARSRAMQVEQKTAQDMEAIYRKAALENADSETRAKLYERKVVMRTNPYTGKQVPGTLDKDGMWKAEFAPEKLDFYKRVPTETLQKEAAALALQNGTSAGDEYQKLNAIEDSRETAHSFRVGHDNLGRPIGQTGDGPAGSPAGPGQAAPPPRNPDVVRPPVDVHDFSKMTPRQKDLRATTVGDILAVQGNKSLNPQEVARQTMILQRMMQLRVEAGGPENFTDPEKAEFLKLVGELQKAQPKGSDKQEPPAMTLMTHQRMKELP